MKQMISNGPTFLRKGNSVNSIKTSKKVHLLIKKSVQIRKRKKVFPSNIINFIETTIKKG